MARLLYIARIMNLNEQLSEDATYDRLCEEISRIVERDRSNDLTFRDQ